MVGLDRGIGRLGQEGPCGVGVPVPVEVVVDVGVEEMAVFARRHSWDPSPTRRRPCGLSHFRLLLLGIGLLLLLAAGTGGPAVWAGM